MWTPILLMDAVQRRGGQRSGSSPYMWTAFMYQDGCYALPLSQGHGPGGSSMAQRILLTGGAGKVATSLRPRLAADGRTIRLLDIVEPQPVEGAGAEEVVIASLDD